MATVEEFLSLDVRVGTVVAAELLVRRTQLRFGLGMEFAGLGARAASVEIAELYEPPDLVGLQVVAVVNLPPRQVAGHTSEVFILSVENGKGENVLLIPERPIPDGGKIR